MGRRKNPKRNYRASKASRSQNSILGLHFGPGDLTGFTSTGLTGFQDLRPAAVVRELIQNSLDAAAEVGSVPAIVHFRRSSCDLSNIPGIDGYIEAFKRAKHSQGAGGTLPDQAKAVVNVIERCLSKKECQILFVLDNGIGLNTKRMRALLGDGISVKIDGATGAFGNGHVVAIPASDLRYVLYGGVTKSGNRIGSGHAILASHEGNVGEPIRSKDGFLVNELKSDNFSSPFVFTKGDQIPALIADQLDWIREKWQCGSAVVIPGFNDFRERASSLWDVIAKAAACNFFAAIAARKLVVQVEEQDSLRILDDQSVAAVLGDNRDEQRTRGPFLAGRHAYEAYCAIKDGYSIEVKAGGGIVRVFIRKLPNGGITRISLCRNGMWVTNSVPTFQGKVSERQPFQSVILLDQQSGELHRLIRKAEGPLHNELSLKFLEADERRYLREALAVIRDRILQEVPELNSSSYTPDDIFTIETSAAAQLAGKGIKPNVVGTATVVRRKSTLTRLRSTERGYKPERKPKRRKGNPLLFRAIAIPTGKRACRVEILPDEACDGAELRLALDENVDVTCDASVHDSLIEMLDVKVDGNTPHSSALVRDDDNRVLGITLDKLEPGSRHVLEVSYSLPSDLLIAEDQDVVLKVEIFRRASPKVREAEGQEVSA